MNKKNILFQYWWLILLFVLLISKKGKLSFTKKGKLTIGDNNDEVLKLQQWINTNYQGYNIKEDSKYGIRTGSALGWIIFEDQDKREEGEGKYFKSVVTNTDYWIDWIDLDWLYSNY